MVLPFTLLTSPSAWESQFSHTHTHSLYFFMNLCVCKWRVVEAGLMRVCLTGALHMEKRPFLGSDTENGKTG